MPYFEEGIRDDVIREWRNQGLPAGKTPSELFPVDRMEEIVLNLEPIPPLNNWPYSFAELNRLRERLNPADFSRLPEQWRKKVKTWRCGDQILILRVHRGFFLSMGVHDWQRFTEVIFLTKDNPEFVSEFLALQSQFSVAMIRRVLKDIAIDAVTFTEPIGGNDGPLLSPEFYASVVLPAYQPIFDCLKEYGVTHFIFKTYANSRTLLPAIYDSEFNCLWACETNVADMDYLDIRKEFGKKFRLIGGIDLDVLRLGKCEIRTEMAKKVPELIHQGGYIPLADGRVRKDIPYENYIYYRELLEKFTTHT